MDKISQYKDITFNSLPEFNDWLEKTAFKTIYLENKGQDITKVFVVESGEIIHTNFQARFWNGRFVNMETLARNTNLCVWNDQTKEWVILRYGITRVVKSK